MHTVKALLLVLVAATAVRCADPPAAKPPPAASRPKPVEVSGETMIDGLVGSHPQFIDGGRLALLSSGGRLSLFDPARGERVGEALLLSSSVVPDPSNPIPGATLSREIQSAVWTFDERERTLFGAVYVRGWGEMDRGLAVWAPAKQDLPLPVRTTAGTPCEPIAISADHATFVARFDPAAASTCNDIRASAIQAFEYGSAKPKGAPVEVGFASCATFSPDQKRVAVGSRTGDVHLFAPDTGQLVTLPRAHQVQVRALAFHPFRPLLASSDVENEIRVWDLARSTPAPIGRKAEQFAFSPDGRYLAIFHLHEWLLLDAESFQPVTAPQKAPYTFANDLAFTADSRRLILMDHSRTFIWRLDVLPMADERKVDTSWFSRLRRLPVPSPSPAPPIEREGYADGRVSGRDGPIAGAEVRLVPHYQEWADARALPELTTRTGAGGLYTFTDIPQITWNAVVTAPGHVKGGYILELRHAKTSHTDVELTPAITLRGTVVGPDRKPAGGVRVVYLGNGYDLKPFEATTAPNGTFVVDHLRAPIDLQLFLRRADGAVRSVKVKKQSAGEVKVAIQLVAPQDPRVVRLAVVDAKGRPVAGAKVTVDASAGVTDEKGLFSIDTTYDHPWVEVTSSQGKATVGKVDLPRRDIVKVTLPAPP